MRKNKLLLLLNGISIVSLTSGTMLCMTSCNQTKHIGQMKFAIEDIVLTSTVYGYSASKLWLMLDGKNVAADPKTTFEFTLTDTFGIQEVNDEKYIYPKTMVDELTTDVLKATYTDGEIQRTALLRVYSVPGLFEFRTGFDGASIRVSSEYTSDLPATTLYLPDHFVQPGTSIYSVVILDQSGFTTCKNVKTLVLPNTIKQLSHYCCACSLDEIIYAGSVEDFKKITQGYCWSGCVDTVTCLDGEFKINGFIDAVSNTTEITGYYNNKLISQKLTETKAGNYTFRFAFKDLIVEGSPPYQHYWHLIPIDKNGNVVKDVIDIKYLYYDNRLARPPEDEDPQWIKNADGSYGMLSINSNFNQNTMIAVNVKVGSVPEGGITLALLAKKNSI